MTAHTSGYSSIASSRKVRVSPSILLAHVLAHEITHILQVSCRHSDRGVMKAGWDGFDYDDMAWAPIAFAKYDIDLIHRGIAARAAAQVALNRETAAEV